MNEMDFLRNDKYIMCNFVKGVKFMKNFRWLFIMSIVVFIALSLVGWGQPSPSLVVESYFEGIQKGEEEDFLVLFNQAKASKSKDLSKMDGRIYELMKDIEFEVTSQKMNKDVSYVNVTVKGPDLASELMQYQTEFIKSSLDGKVTSKWDETLMLSCLEEVNYSQRTAELRLVKLDGKWKISDGRESILYLLFNLQSGMFEE